MTFRKVPWPCFQRSSQRVVPAIEKTKQSNNCNYLQYLVVIEVTAQFRELGIPNGIRYLAGGLREAKGCAFLLTELGALLELSQRFNFADRDISESRKIGRMRGTILTLSGAAYHVHDECLQTRIKPAWANDDQRGEL